MPDHGTQLEIDWLPAFSGGTLSGPGRWFATDVGYIWTNDKGNLNILDFNNDQAVKNFIIEKQLMKDRGLSASQAFNLLFSGEQEENPYVKQESGQLTELDQQYTHFMSTTITAAGPPVPGVQVQTVEYGITVDENGDVLELVKISPDGVFVRLNGAWSAVDLDAEESDSDTVFGQEWRDVHEGAVELYDLNETADSVPSETFDSVIIN